MSHMIPTRHFKNLCKAHVFAHQKGRPAGHSENAAGWRSRARVHRHRHAWAPRTAVFVKAKFVVRKSQCAQKTNTYSYSRWLVTPSSALVFLNFQFHEICSNTSPSALPVFQQSSGQTSWTSRTVLYSFCIITYYHQYYAYDDFSMVRQIVCGI